MFICPNSDHCMVTSTASQLDFNFDYSQEYTAGVLFNFDDMTNYTMFRLSNLSLSDLTFGHEDTQILRGHRIWPFFFWITFIVGLGGNSLVVYVICRMKQLRTVTNMYLLNLAIVDILYLIATIPNTSYGWTDYWPFGEFMCKFISYLMGVTMTVSILTLTAVGLDRHYVILYPVSSRQHRTLMKTIPVIIAFWIFSFAVSSPSLFIARKIVFFGDDVCLNYWQKPWGHKAYAVSMFVFLYVIPQFVLVVCYFRIGNKLWFSVRFQGRPKGCSLQKLRTRRRVVKMVIIVTVAFAVCWLPVHVVELYMAFGSNFTRIFYELKLLAPLVPHLFIATNPIIYCFMSKTFRLHFKAACTCTTTLLNSISVDEQEGNMHDTLDVRRARKEEDISMEVTNNRDISTQTCHTQPCDNNLLSPYNNNGKKSTSYHNLTSSSSTGDSSRNNSMATKV